MTPGDEPKKEPNRAAYIMAETGQAVSYSELEDHANQTAQLFRSLGLKRGDHIAILLENHPWFSLGFISFKCRCITRQATSFRYFYFLFGFLKTLFCKLNRLGKVIQRF